MECSSSSCFICGEDLGGPANLFQLATRERVCAHPGTCSEAMKVHGALFIASHVRPAKPAEREFFKKCQARSLDQTVRLGRLA